MYSISDLQKLVQMLSFLGISPGSGAPAHTVVLGGGTYATPGVSGTLLASNGASADPTFQSLASLGIQPALGYAPAHAGANSDITSLGGLTTPLSIAQGGTGANTAGGALTALGAQAALGFTPVQQGGGAGQFSDKIFIGWSGTKLKAQVDVTDLGNIALESYVQSRFIPNILDYGGDPGGTVDNAAALTAALAASSTGQAAVYFPPGTYAFASQVAYTLPNGTAGVSLFGAGPSQSILKWAANGGIKVTMPGGQGNSIHVRDLSLLAGAAGTGNAAITLVNATNSVNPFPNEVSDISNVSFHGTDGYAATNYWPECVLTQSWSNVNFVSCNFFGGGGGGDLSGYAGQGTGISFTGSSGSGAPPQGVAYNIIGCNFGYSLQGILYNNWVQGVSVSTSNFTGGKYGIFVATPNQAQDQLTVTSSQFNCSDAGILDQVGVAGTMIIGNYFFVPTPTTGGNAGINLAATYETTIMGNVFQRIGSAATNTNGIIIGSNSYAGAMITGNVITGMGTGIFLQSTSGDANVQSNKYHANTTNIVNSGTGNVLGGGSQ